MKIMRLFYAILLCIMSMGTAMAQETFSKDGIYYRVNANQKNVTVVACDDEEESYSGNITIPAKVTNGSVTYNVTNIGESAFNQSDITSISLPEGLLSIGKSAFRECQGLKSVTIPSSVLVIEREAFIFCFSLSKLTFKGKTRPTIENYAFGRTQIEMKGISTGIPANMAVPGKDKRVKVVTTRGYAIY